MGQPALLRQPVLGLGGELGHRVPREEFRVTLRLVASSATALAPFSQNSASLRPPGSSGHAHPGQSNPCAGSAATTSPPCARAHLLQTAVQGHHHGLDARGLVLGPGDHRRMLVVACVDIVVGGPAGRHGINLCERTQARDA